MTKVYSVVNKSFVISGNIGPLETQAPNSTVWEPVTGSAKLTQNQQFRTTDEALFSRFDHYVKIGYLKLVAEIPDPPAPVVVGDPAVTPQAPESGHAAAAEEPEHAEVSEVSHKS